MKNKSWLFLVILFVGIAILIGGMLFLGWLFRTPNDWGVTL